MEGGCAVHSPAAPVEVRDWNERLKRMVVQLIEGDLAQVVHVNGRHGERQAQQRCQPIEASHRRGGLLSLFREIVPELKTLCLLTAALGRCMKPGLQFGNHGSTAGRLPIGGYRPSPGNMCGEIISPRLAGFRLLTERLSDGLSYASDRFLIL